MGVFTASPSERCLPCWSRGKARLWGFGCQNSGVQTKIQLPPRREQRWVPSAWTAALSRASALAPSSFGTAAPPRVGF